MKETQWIRTDYATDPYEGSTAKPTSEKISVKLTTGTYSTAPILQPMSKDVLSVNGQPIVGETREKPKNPQRGAFFYNTDFGFAEIWDGTDWVNLADILVYLKELKVNKRREAILAQKEKDKI